MDTIVRRSARVAGIALCLFAHGSLVFAQNPAEPPRVLSSVQAQFAQLPQDMQEQLVTANQVINTSFGLDSPQIAPPFIVPVIDQLLPAASGGETAESTPGTTNLQVEGLFFIPLSGEQSARVDDLVIYNITRTPSTMAGIEYYSASRQRWRTFYHESYVIADPQSRTALMDPIVNTIPAADTQYFRQRDSSFGVNTYLARYTYTDGIILLDIANTKPVHYFILKLADPGNLHTSMIIRRFQEGILFYGLSRIDTKSFYGFEERAERSIVNRVKAIFSWFEMRLFEEIDTVA